MNTGAEIKEQAEEGGAGKPRKKRDMMGQPVKPGLGKQEQKTQEFKATFSYLSELKSSLDHSKF